MNNWKNTVVHPESTIQEALLGIDRGGVQIALVVDHDERLLGTVTDGDIRRALLNGVNLTASVSAVMNRSPVTLGENEDRKCALDLMQARRVKQLPVVDASQRVVGLMLFDELFRPALRKNTVVLMAGGEGLRLRPMTENTPKPMLRVGGRPILETILLNFIDYGFCDFHFSVNYLAEQIRDYFGDGKKWGVSIRYLEEDRKLGTAGALSLLGGAYLKEPLIVMNGDVLTRTNFQHLLEFHKIRQCDATMCVREHDVQVPYGVLRVHDEQIVEIQEKPVTRHFINAGIYVLEPKLIQQLEPGGRCDMPSLLDKVIQSGGKVAAFPLREYWLDIGQKADFERGLADYPEQFT